MSFVKICSLEQYAEMLLYVSEDIYSKLTGKLAYSKYFLFIFFRGGGSCCSVHNFSADSFKFIVS